jgi:hypothetical protein
MVPFFPFFVISLAGAYVGASNQSRVLKRAANRWYNYA